MTKLCVAGHFVLMEPFPKPSQEIVVQVAQERIQWKKILLVVIAQLMKSKMIFVSLSTFIEKKKRSSSCDKIVDKIVCGWPLCPDGAIPETQPGDCCPSCPGK